MADIHTGFVVSADVVGSFRELVLFIQDDNILTRLGNSSGSSYNLRVEPPGPRGRAPPELFHGAAPWRPRDAGARGPGDPVVVRALVAGTNDVHTWHLDGHRFRIEPYKPHLAARQHRPPGDLRALRPAIPRAGGPLGRAGDYLYHSGRIFKLREGSWGLLRVRPPGASGACGPCPARGDSTPSRRALPQEAPRKEFAVVAVSLPLPMLGGSRGLAYVLEQDRAAVPAGGRPPQPLVLHVNVGDCLEVWLRNETDAPVSLHADLLAYDPAGRPDPFRLMRSGYTFFAHPEVGETAALLRDTGNMLENLDWDSMEQSS